LKRKQAPAPEEIPDAEDELVIERVGRWPAASLDPWPTSRGA